MRFFHIAFFLLYFVFQVNAQEKKTENRLRYGGLAHLHFSYAETKDKPYGFRLRRFDFRIWKQISSKLKWNSVIAFSDFKFRILEADIDYRVNENLSLRAGNFGPPAIRTGAPFDKMFTVPGMLLIERATIILKWANRSDLIAYRTFGVQAYGKLLNKSLRYACMLSTPKSNSFFKPSAKDLVYDGTMKGFGAWGSLEYKIGENFVLGGFSNFLRSDLDSFPVVKTTYGAYAILKARHVSFMTEFVEGFRFYKEVQTAHYRGLNCEFAYRFSRIEPAMRFDFYTPSVGALDENKIEHYINYTAGLNAYLSKKIRFQINYVIKKERAKGGYMEVPNNLLYVNFQCLL